MRDLLLCSVWLAVLPLPSLAYAHGDDSVTVASFIGPMLGLIVLVAVVSLGKAFLRRIVKRA